MPKGPHLEFELPVVELAQQIEDMMKNSSVSQDELKDLQAKKDRLHRRIQKKWNAWNRVELARRAGRPLTLDYTQSMLEEFVEIHGDRRFGDDPAIVTGFAKLSGRPVAVVGNQKGKDTSDSIRRNFGMAHPEGYRKALRLMRLAEKFHLPVISFIDTPGAYPGIGAEERGQAQAIAENLKVMSQLAVPVLVTVIGEGASGGALGIGVGDRLLMLENAWYCVISPEGCAAILWGDSSKKRELSSVMKLTARDLKDLGIVDRIVPESLGGAHWNHEEVFATLKGVLWEELSALERLSRQELLDKRFAKFSGIGALDMAGR